MITGEIAEHSDVLYISVNIQASIRFRNVFMGIFDHSSKSTFVRSHTDVGWEGLALSLRSNSS